MAKRKVSPDENENREDNTADTVDDDDIAATATDATTCLFEHVTRIYNMRRFDDQIQFQLDCKICDRKYWQPANILKRNHPQKVIDFYESCIEWKHN